MARKPKVEDTTAIIDKEDHIIDKEFIELLDERFTNYAFAVMEDRALPDARDGLKPSQRRTLVAMNDLSLRSSGKTKKCAKICGDVSGNYHPHGEAVVYPTLVRMAQDWSLRYPLFIHKVTLALLLLKISQLLCVTPKQSFLLLVIKWLLSFQIKL